MNPGSDNCFCMFIFVILPTVSALYLSSMYRHGFLVLASLRANMFSRARSLGRGSGSFSVCTSHDSKLQPTHVPDFGFPKLTLQNLPGKLWLGTGGHLNILFF